MENNGVVIDTNIFIEHLRAKDKQSTRLSQLKEGNTWKDTYTFSLFLAKWLLL